MKKRRWGRIVNFASLQSRRAFPGGLTTIEEKVLGNIQKIGRECMIDGVLDKADTPTGPGLWFMDSSSAAAEMVTYCAAAGFAVHLFPTGQGNVIGNPIVPVIKPCANARLIAAETLGHREFVLTRRYAKSTASRYNMALCEKNDIER